MAEQHQTVAPAEARTFVQSFVPDPKILEGMADEDVVAYHGNVTKVLGEHVQKANESRDWRKEIAGDNPDAMKTLERFPSPKALYESYDQFRGKLSKGEMRVVAAFPEKGTEEEKNTWRQQNGVPVDGKYEVKLPDGLTIGDADKPVLESFTKFAHEKNLPAEAVNVAASWFFGERAKRREEVQALVAQEKQDTAAELGTEWGAEYKGIKNRIGGVLDSSLPTDEKGAEVKAALMDAIDRNPVLARMFGKIALDLNPGNTLVPGDRGANEGSVVDELKKIEAGRRKDRVAYNKDETLQARERDLIAAYSRLTGKEWGRE